MSKVIYDVPASVFSILLQRLEKLNKRAAKLGSHPVEIKIHEEVMVPDRNKVAQVLEVYDRNEQDAAIEKLPKIKVFRVSIEGAAPKLDGWKFLGTLDHVTLPSTVIVNTVPGENIPTKFHNNKPVCDHCGKVRYRKETFIVEHEEGEQKQVGRQCLKDFLGHNPTSILGFMNALHEFEEDMERGFGGFGRSEEYYNLDTVLQLTAATIASIGWTPRSAANETRMSTSSYVWNLLNPPLNNNDRKEFNYVKELVGDVTEQHKKEANDALEWLKDQPDNNEYMHNIKAIGQVKDLPGKLLGYACSIIAAYQRAQEHLRTDNDNRLNEWISGEIKERLEMTVTLQKIRRIDSFYGITSIHRMLDDTGKTIVWFASTDSVMEEGKTYRVKGTIKKFDEFNDWKQTIVNRVKVLEELVD